MRRNEGARVTFVVMVYDVREQGQFTITPLKLEKKLTELTCFQNILNAI